jgi:abhydrolase domain-containing protein 2
MHLLLFLGPNSKALFVLSQFGGHLGFYEGGLLQRATETWLNKVILQYINAVLTIQESHTYDTKK